MFPDEKTVQDCGLKEGDKVYVVVKKDQLGTPSPEPQSAHRESLDPSSQLWQRLHGFLQKHFREQDIRSILREFQKVCSIRLICTYYNKDLKKT